MDEDGVAAEVRRADGSLQVNCYCVVRCSWVVERVVRATQSALTTRSVIVYDSRLSRNGDGNAINEIFTSCLTIESGIRMCEANS